MSLLVSAEPPPLSLFVFLVCAYGGIFGCLLYSDDVWFRVVYEVFSSSILFVMPFMLI